MTRIQKVTNTSRISFHTNQDAIRSQRQAVAEFILSETRAWRWTWIRKIAENADKIGHPGLSQISSASRALNQLKNCVVVLAGQEWVLNKGVSCKYPGCKTAVEPWCFILKNSEKISVNPPVTAPNNIK